MVRVTAKLFQNGLLREPPMKSIFNAAIGMFALELESQ